MYSYTYDEETGGLLLNSSPLAFSKEPRPVYYEELDLLGFDKIWTYEKDKTRPYMWAEANNYYYKGRLVAKLKGGSLFSVPEIILIESPETDGKTLSQVDIETMVEKNRFIMESLAHNSIKFIYNTYIKYKDKVDIFHVSYSGGKDSEVLFDLVQKALPHNSFITVFGNTQMEFPDTYKAVSLIKQRCKELNIQFLESVSDSNPLDTWRIFGPPSTTIRWCCSVHKTTPQLLKLRDYIGKESFTEMAYVGVRGDESERRAGYDYISFSTKHKGQYSCNPLLDWNSAEVYLYIYSNQLHINDAYKKGNSRAGCLICPMASQKNDFMNHFSYPKESQKFIDIIKELNVSDKDNPERLRSYLENIGWRARKNGRDLTIASKSYDESVVSNNVVIRFINRNDEWKQWIRTIGLFVETDTPNVFRVDYLGKLYTFHISELEVNYLQVVLPSASTKTEIEFLQRFKRVFRKSHYCAACRVCEANCKFGYLKFIDGKINISKNCKHCGLCFEIDTGCLVYRSLWLSKGNGNMKKESLDCYANHPPKMSWFADYLKLEDRFWSENELGNNEIPAFRKFLRHSGILEKDKETKLAKLFREKGINDDLIWTIILVNLSFTPEVGWFIRNTCFEENITQKYLKDRLSEEEGISASGIKSIPPALRRIALLPFCKLGFGAEVGKSKEDGFVLRRTVWQNPDSKVILYSLYKFAEACGDYYQFSLTRLMDTAVESDGVSPTQIFGLDKDTMTALLKGLAINYPEFISVAFTLDLDNINLRQDKSSNDVLELF